MISGGWLIVEHLSYPSILWVGIALLLLVLISSLLGMIHKNIKIINLAEKSEEKLLHNVLKL
ncbi:hypothetical protein ACQKP0_15130 [Heyndrickxia sp. NPDC080065]|uniref:hypothetical protein n=1 Tax=Heyndrickxia sp. NPDC080065 TaxID=3390568 RepID=UPI003CFD3219